MIFVGHDWAEDHHDVVVLDVDGALLKGARLGEGVEGAARFHALVAELDDTPQTRAVDTARPKTSRPTRVTSYPNDSPRRAP